MDDLRSKFIKIKIRPQRIAVLVPMDAAWEQLRPVIRFLSVVWGGRYGTIIPIDPGNNGDNSTAAKWLSTYDPDLVLQAPGLTGIDLNNFLTDTCRPFSSLPFFDNIEDNFRYNPGEFISLKGPVDEFIKEVNSQGEMLGPYYQIVSCDEDIQDSYLIQSMFGVWEKKEAESLAENVKGRAVHIGQGSSISDYIKLFIQQDYPWTGLDLSNRKIIDGSGMFRIEPPTIYLGTSSAIDVAYFWNLRASFNPISNNILYLNESVIDDDEAIETLVEWMCLPRRNIKPTYCRILSPTGSSDKPHRLAKRLRLRVKNKGIAHVDVDNPNLEIPRVVFLKEEIPIEAQIFDGQNLEFKCPPFTYDRGSWVIELSKDMYSRRYILDHLPPLATMNSSYEVLNTPSPFRPEISNPVFRYFDGNICRKIDNRIDVIKITIPTSHEIFTSYLSQFGVKSVQDEKRLRYEACINMFGSLMETAQCFREKFRRVFSAFENTPLTFDEILGKAKWEKKTNNQDEDEFIVRLSKTPIMKDIARSRCQAKEGMLSRIYEIKDFLNRLIDKKIILRRILLPPCKSCLEKNSWTERLDLRELPTCSNCGAPLTLTDKMEIGYLLNPLLNKAIMEGAIPVILTLQFLGNLTSSGFMYLPGFKGALDQGHFDIDIIAACDGVLVFCECKSLGEKNPSKKVWREIKDQFEHLIEKARKFKAQIAILSSLTKEYPAMIKELVKKYSDESLSVVLLDKDDLEKGIRWQTILDEETESKYPLSIRGFLPQQKENRKKRKGNRKIICGYFDNLGGKKGDR